MFLFGMWKEMADFPIINKNYFLNTNEEEPLGSKSEFNTLAHEDYYIKVVLQSNKHFVALKLTISCWFLNGVNFLAYPF